MAAFITLPSPAMKTFKLMVGHQMYLQSKSLQRMLQYCTKY
jgi:hypothetical protein